MGDGRQGQATDIKTEGKVIHDKTKTGAYESVISEINSFLTNSTPEQRAEIAGGQELINDCLLYTSPSPRDGLLSRMPSSA